jgi:hypothetical protein
VPTIKVYPSARHVFDSPFSPTFYLDRLTGRNDEAATDFYAVTKAYFAAGSRRSSSMEARSFRASLSHQHLSRERAGGLHP